MRADRIEKHEAVLVDIIDCEKDPELENTSMTCMTVDISETGMKVSTGFPIPVATRLGLRLDFAHQLYRLQAIVRWTMDDREHYAGLLLDDHSMDIHGWQRMFELGF